MRVTVSICTWNRSALLRQTLTQMTRLRVPPGIEWELIIVNNNCTDATDDVIESFSRQLPIRRLFEQEPGLSNARNHAIRHATGEYILWTDDDVLVDEEWLAAYCEAFSRFPDAAFFGGPIEPWFEEESPSWLAQVLPFVGSAYALRALGDQPCPFSMDVVPYGANFVVRKKEQVMYSYDNALGVRPDSNMGGEEVALIWAMLDAGLAGWWVPQARVRHYIPRSRQTIRYLRRYFFGLGQWEARAMRSESNRKVFGIPGWLLREAACNEAKYHYSRLLSKPESWIMPLIESSRTWGVLHSLATHKRT